MVKADRDRAREMASQLPACGEDQADEDGRRAERPRLELGVVLRGHVVRMACRPGAQTFFRVG